MQVEFKLLLELASVKFPTSKQHREATMLKLQRAFTLIELMIVIAILGILLAIAIPAYSDFTIRARVADGMNLATSAKYAVSEYFSATSSLPSSNSDVGLTTSTEISSTNVRSVEVTALGVVVITYRNVTEIDGSTLRLEPEAPAGAGSVQWTCGVSGAGTVLARYKPASCRN